jgi:hypothetical protein
VHLAHRNSGDLTKRTLCQDLWYLVCMLKKNPGFIMVAVLTLAVAIRESYFRRIPGATPGQYQKANFFRARPPITAERVLAYRLRSGEKLLWHWAKLRAASRLSALPVPAMKLGRDRTGGCLCFGV